MKKAAASAALSGGGRADGTQHGGIQPDSGRADGTRHDSIQPGGGRADGMRTEGAKSDAVLPLKVGDILEFRIDYASMVYVTASRNVHIIYV